MCEENKQRGNKLVQRMSSVLQVLVAPHQRFLTLFYTGGPVKIEEGHINSVVSLHKVLPVLVWIP
jgi:hypothetical protein